MEDKQRRCYYISLVEKIGSNMEARFYVLTFVLVLAVFAPAAMTCYGRDISIHNFYKIENSRMVLQRRIPDDDSRYYWRRGNTAATRVSPPVASRAKGQGLPPNSPPGVIH